MNRRQWRARLSTFRAQVNAVWRRTPDRIPETPLWVLADQTAAGEAARRRTRWF